MYTCIVCGSTMEAYFTKPAFRGLPAQHHERCVSCGFVGNRTLAEMPQAEWAAFNHHFHQGWQGQDHNDDDPRWRERMDRQVETINMAKANGMFDLDRPMLDYACGDGYIAKRCGLEEWDPYMRQGQAQPMPGRYGFVLTTSVFEHLRTSEDLEFIESCVHAHGIMGIHTLVCEEVPCDPDWFYLLPMHCAFFTNESMRRLMQRWSYFGSAYHVPSRLWFLAPQKTYTRMAAVALDLAAPSHSAPTWHFQEGFVDYWKSPPLQFNRTEPTVTR